jgi:hypothetical protein
MSDEPPYKPAPLPDVVVQARRQSAAQEAAAVQAVQPELDAALGVGRTALAEVAHFDALQRSDAARQVADEQSALSALQQPLMDQLKLNKITANPVFSESCPYCLSEIGL